MPRLSNLVVCALIGATLALPAAAQWKWRDKNGQIQYSDLPPPAGVSDHDILQRPAAAQRRLAGAAPASNAAAASAPMKTIDADLEAKRKQAAHEQDAKQEAKKKAEEEKLAAARAENCARARSHLRTIDEGMRIARVNDKGEREILDDKQRAEEAQRTRDIIASDCK